MKRQASKSASVIDSKSAPLQPAGSFPSQSAETLEEKGKTPFQNLPPSLKSDEGFSRESASNNTSGVLLSPISPKELKSKITRKRQNGWNTEMRITGLLLLIDYFARNGKRNVSQDMSLDYVSQLKSKEPGAIKNPLPLLVELRILEKVEEAIVSPYQQKPAAYRIHPKAGKPESVEVNLTKLQQRKLATAPERKEKRLNRKNRTRQKLITDLELVGLSPAGDRKALSMMAKNSKATAIKALIQGVEAESKPPPKYDPAGTIHSFPRQCPKELKPHLTIGGEPVELVDLEAAHVCTLALLARERIGWRAERGQHSDELDDELRSFIGLLESADIYEHLADEGCDRDTMKDALLGTLNMQTRKAIHLRPYQLFKRAFPLIGLIVEDMKKGDHRQLSRFMIKHQSTITEGALFECQQEGIPAIPDTDGLIVPKQHGEQARIILHKHLFDVTGVKR